MENEILNCSSGSDVKIEFELCSDPVSGKMLADEINCPGILRRRVSDRIREMVPNCCDFTWSVSARYEYGYQLMVIAYGRPRVREAFDWDAPEIIGGSET